MKSIYQLVQALGVVTNSKAAIYDNNGRLSMTGIKLGNQDVVSSADELNILV